MDGFIGVEVGLLHGTDVVKRSIQALLRGAIVAGVFDAVHAGPPCSSFSRARERGWHQRLRSVSLPHGLPGLSEKDSSLVKSGNACAKLAISLANVAMHHGVPGSLENPASSRMWMLPSFRRFLSRPGVRKYKSRRLLLRNGLEKAS